MVSTFSQLRTPAIVFGENRSGEAGSHLKPGTRHVLIIIGGKSHLNNRSYSLLVDSVEKTGCTISFEKIDKEPRPDDIDRITGKAVYHDVDAVIVAGGGSVLDAGKAVSAMLPVQEPVKEYLEGVGTKKHSGVKRFFIAVPSTSGTGSEATSNAVLSQTGENGFKRSLRHENFVPDIAIVDPLMTVGCPSEITASSGMDAFTQLLESYVSLKANPLTDALALEGIAKIHENLVKAVVNGDNVQARSGMSFAALLSGITLANAGLGLIHGFASSVGALLDIPHGTVCGTLMGVVNRFNIESLLNQPEVSIAQHKYAAVGRLLSGVPDKELTWYMKYVAAYIENLTQQLNLKRLGEYGLKISDLDKIASATDHKANPVKFTRDAMVSMLTERI